MKKVVLLAPIGLTLLLVAWTAMTYNYSKYGSWYVYPALIIPLPVLLGHVLLILTRTPRRPYVLYAVIHLLIFVPLWIGCLMLISKDSL
jgi:hypothetical protein